ncbi:MAG TPA: HD domain-containing protein [Planctomycetota bacterium]|nr:HD domain-containing protein [Planctomycetota bacterium]
MSGSRRKFLVLRDAVHGDVTLTEEERRVLDTAAFQRLRGVRQLGSAYLVYPGAHHTRFEHAIGTLEMASRIVEAVNRNRDLEPARCLGIAPEEARIVRLAALLHDVTHIPHGHNIEDQTGLLERHDTPTRFAAALGPGTEIGRVLESLGARESVLRALYPVDHPERRGIPAYWTQLFADTICADILDYLSRDAHYTGLALGVDPRIVRHFRVDRGTGNLFLDLGKRSLLREDILSEIVRMLEARYYFSERVYYHHAKITAGALVAKAAEWALTSGALRGEDFHDATDASLLDRLENAPYSEDRVRAKVRDLIRRFRERRLFKRACVYPVYKNRRWQEEVVARFFAPGRFPERIEAEERIASRVRASVGREVVVSLYCPARNMQLKEARIHVLWPGEEGVRPLSDFADRLPRLRDLEDSYRSLWKCYVLVSEDDPAVLRATQRACAEEFPDAVNVYEVEG